MAKFVERNKGLYIELRDLLKKEESEIKRRTASNIIREDLSANIYKYYIYTIE